MNAYGYARHYLKGTPIHYRSLDYDYWRINWEFDEENNYCTKTRTEIFGVTELYQYIGQDNSIAFKFIEFIETQHRILELVFHNQSNVFEIIGEDIYDMTDNIKLLNCGHRPTAPTDPPPIIDCRENPKLDPSVTEETDFIMGSHEKDEKAEHKTYWVIITYIDCKQMLIT